MARKPRIQYAGAVYHVMNRGDRRQDIFLDDRDRFRFLDTLAEVCERTGWRVHAYVLMSNHFHLLLETPEPNLVVGMKWFLGTYTQRLNLRHGLNGHLFQGRYKSPLVDVADASYFAVAHHYVHLNPARATLYDVKGGDLRDYRWSSFPAYLQPKRRPPWLDVHRIFACLQLADTPRGRTLYRQMMNAKAVEVVTAKDSPMRDEGWPAIRRGWCFGAKEFRADLLRRLDATPGKRQSYAGEEVVQHDEREAERFVIEGLNVIGVSEHDLKRLRKGAVEKALIAWLVRRHTSVSNAWIANRLCMGRADALSRYTTRIETTRSRSLIVKREQLREIARFRD